MKEFEHDKRHDGEERRPRRDDDERRPRGDRDGFRPNRDGEERRPRQDDDERRPRGDRDGFRSNRDGEERRPRRDDDERRPRGDRDGFRSNRDGEERRPRGDGDEHRSGSFGREDRGGPRRPPLLETAKEVDTEILRLIVRRGNLLNKMRNRQGRLDPGEERELRLNWEKNSSRISKDSRLAGTLFSLLQEVELLPRPADNEERRPAFNLSPTPKPIDVSLDAPGSSRMARLLMAMAAASGSECRISGAPLNDPVVELIKAFNQAGASLAWEENGELLSRAGGGLKFADKAIFVGDDSLNLHLLLGHFVGRCSRVRFTGESELKLADFSSLRHFLPKLGARLTNAVPKSDGLPARLECSGELPDSVVIPADLSVDAVLGLLLAAPFWERPVAFDLAEHSKKKEIMAEVREIFAICGLEFRRENDTLKLEPGKAATMPGRPVLPVDLTLSAYMMALAANPGGRVALRGEWPRNAPARLVGDFLGAVGITVEITPLGAAARRESKNVLERLDAGELPADFLPLTLALACQKAHHQEGGIEVNLPAGAEDSAAMESMLTYAGFEFVEGRLRGAAEPPVPASDGGKETAWTAPSPFWALALALVSFARPGLKLGNPGIMTALYPAFWPLFNGLPNPGRQANQDSENSSNEQPTRRRFIAG